MRTTRIALLAVVCFALGAVVMSRITTAETKDAAKTTKAPTPEEMMALVAKYGTPGPEHKKLAQLVGTFDADVTMQMSPETPPMMSKGKTVNQMIMGGRFLHGDYTGDFGGREFMGSSIFGYNNYTKKYISGWIDSMSTGIMFAEGDSADDGKTISVKCTFDCPITNDKKTVREVMTIVDADHYTYESFEPGAGADGKDLKTMSIKYTRSK
jgi:hypothetical protein